MEFAVQKVLDAGNPCAMVTDRGTMFGYRDLIVDFTGIPVMKRYAPVVMDVTHSLQQPNTASGVTGGRPEMIELIARNAIVSGADGIFLETHPEPGVAKSDGANMLRIDRLETLLEHLVVLRRTVREFEKRRKPSGRGGKASSGGARQKAGAKPPLLLGPPEAPCQRSSSSKRATIASASSRHCRRMSSRIPCFISTGWPTISKRLFSANSPKLFTAAPAQENEPK